jgi:8-oxo-dGTP pyrophosphatase MutT (NUDIX family)
MTEWPFDHDPSVAEFAVPKHVYLAARPGASFGYIATSSLVMDKMTTADRRLLLLQRAASDEHYPNKWEPPGGACDDDKSILHAVARELWEEAGLQAARIRGPVGQPHCFTVTVNGEDLRVCLFSFAVQQVQVVSPDGSPPEVKLDPKEHQRFVWATEDEVKAKKVGDVHLDFTREEVERTVLLAFEYFNDS